MTPTERVPGSPAAVEPGDRRGDRTRIVRAHLLGAQIGDVRHEHGETGAHQGLRECYEARIVLALRHDARHQHQGGLRAVRPVEVAHRHAGAWRKGHGGRRYHGCLRACVGL